jgi:putative transcriptional regulator
MDYFKKKYVSLLRNYQLHVIINYVRRCYIKMSCTNDRKVRSVFKSARQQKGTQRKVAIDLGITETTVRNIENGHSDPGLDLVFGFAAYFEISTQELWPDLVERGTKRLLNSTT